MLSLCIQLLHRLFEPDLPTKKSELWRLFVSQNFIETIILSKIFSYQSRQNLHNHERDSQDIRIAQNLKPKIHQEIFSETTQILASKIYKHAKNQFLSYEFFVQSTENKVGMPIKQPPPATTK